MPPEDKKNVDQATINADKGLDDPAFDELWKAPPAKEAPTEPSQPKSPSENGPEEVEEGEEAGHEEDGSEPGEEETVEEESAEEEGAELSLDAIQDKDLRQRIQQEIQKGREALKQVVELSTRVNQLDRKVGEQGAEMGALRKQHVEAQKELGSKLQEMDQQRIQGIQNFEAQIEAAREAEDDFTRINLQDQLEIFKRGHGNERWRIVKQFADETEAAFLAAKGNEPYREVKGSFEGFLTDHGLEVISIKSDPRLLAKYYDTHYRAERGRPENIKKITEEGRRAKLESAARVKNAAQPGAGSRKGEPQPTKEKSGVTWDTTPTSGGVL